MRYIFNPMHLTQMLLPKIWKFRVYVSIIKTVFNDLVYSVSVGLLENI